MQTEEYLIQHYARRVSDTERGVLVLSMVNANRSSPLEGEITCGELLQAIHQIEDSATKEQILTKDLGNGEPGRNFRIACIVFCGVLFLYVVLTVLHTARNGSDPEGDLAQVHSVYDAVVELVKAILESDQQ